MVNLRGGVAAVGREKKNKKRDPVAVADISHSRTTSPAAVAVFSILISRCYRTISTLS